MASKLQPFLNAQRLRDLTRHGIQPKTLPSWTSKLIYSSHFEKISPVLSYKRKVQEKVRLSNEILDDCIKVSKSNNVPVSLKFLAPEIPSATEGNNQENDYVSHTKHVTELQFPYKYFNKVDTLQIEEGLKRPDYSDEEDRPSHWFEDYGTLDPSIAASDVPCGGCGALLHCQDTAIPGYTPSERIKRMKKVELRSELCQRCYFLSYHNTALKVNVSAEDYPKILSQIKEKKALVIVLVDLLDFPCSLWPGIVDILGRKRPVFLVGNKVDLLPRDSNSYIQHLTRCVENIARDNGFNDVNLIHTALISATTGFGVENLIDKIFSLWGFKGDIYIMGCTNVGKSSLFNAFIQSDLCKVQAIDLIQRATISPWPGTTLNLLKFPVTRPVGWRKSMRAKRLREDNRTLAEIRSYREQEFKDTRNPQKMTLIGHIGRTFVSDEKLEEAERLKDVKDIFGVNPFAKVENVETPKKGDWDPEDPRFAMGRWCFDTPGAVADNQILDQLTLEELMLTIPKTIIVPRTYLIHPGMSFFVGGLARLDYKEGKYSIRLIVFASQHLQINISKTEDAEEVYREGLGGPIFGVPFGNEVRMKEFPPLRGKYFNITGIHRTICTADIVISSTGWIGLSIPAKEEVKIEVLTPNAKGIFCRMPSFLPNITALKGRKLRGSLSYSTPSSLSGRE